MLHFAPREAEGDTPTDLTTNILSTEASATVATLSSIITSSLLPSTMSSGVLQYFHVRDVMGPKVWKMF